MADRLRALECTQQTLHHVIDIAPGTDLTAVAVDGDRLVLQRTPNEYLERPFSRLSRTVDIAWAYRNRGQPVLPVVGEREVLSSELAYRIDPAPFARRAGNGVHLLAHP